MPNPHARYVCLVLLAVGAVAALVAAAARVPVEAGNHTVALILDYDQVRELGSVGGLTTRELLGRLKQAGATHVAITEQTLRTVLAGGEVVAAPVRPQDQAGLLRPTASFVGPPDTIQRLQRSLAERLGLGRRTATIVPDRSGALRLNVSAVDPEDILDLGIGYPTTAVQQVNLVGLAFVPRPFAEHNQWQAATTAALTLAKERNTSLVIFAGTAAPGYPSSIAQAADEFRRRGLLFGYIEFGKQYGDMALASRLPDHLIRVHSISETEMLGMSVQRAVDRFALAVRERNLRACYVRLFEPSGTDPVAAAEDYIRALSARLRSHGLVLGEPAPFEDLGLSLGLPWFAVLGALAALGLCLTELLGVRLGPAMSTVSVGFALLLLVAGLAAPDLSLKLAALLAALALPTFAVGRYRSIATVASRWMALGKGLLLFAATSGISVVGGLLIVGCLADTRFMVKLDQFSGVKLAHLGPLLAVLLLQIGWDLGARGEREGEPPLTTLLRGWRAAAESMVKYWQAALLLLCVAGLGLLVLRSGNESGVGVSSLELHFRAVLDRVFGVRPRTKEVLIGHPLLILALARAAVGKTRGRWALLTLGAIGQVSMVNTFSHLHTPLGVSMARTLHGLWLGSLLGVGLYFAVELAERLWGIFWRRFSREPADAT